MRKKTKYNDNTITITIVVASLALFFAGFHVRGVLEDYSNTDKVIHNIHLEKVYVNRHGDDNPINDSYVIPKDVRNGWVQYKTAEYGIQILGIKPFLKAFDLADWECSTHGHRASLGELKSFTEKYKCREWFHNK